MTIPTLWKSIMIILLIIGAAFPAYAIIATPPQITDTMREGEVRTYTLNGPEYEVALVFVSDPTTGGRLEAKFSVNGQLTAALAPGESADVGSANIYITNILKNNSEGIATFTLTYTGNNVPSTGQCNDSDGGIIGGMKGLLIFNGQMVGYDSCNQQGMLNELYCTNANTAYTSELIRCQYGCEDGVCKPTPSAEEKNFIVVVGERSPVADVVLAVDIAKFAQEKYGRNWYDINGAAMLDTQAYAKYSQNWMSQKLFFVINGKSTTIIVGQQASTDKVVKANDVRQYLQSRGYSVTIKMSTDITSDIFIIKPESATYCTYNGVQYKAGTNFRDDCNTCTCTEKGMVACTEMKCVGPTQYSLSEGESKTYTINGRDVEVSLVWMSGNQIGEIVSDKFSINGAITPALTPGESTIIDGVKLTLLYNNAGSANDPRGMATFSLEIVPTETGQYILKEGESKTYTIGGKDHEITLVFVSDPNPGQEITSRFSINGEQTGQLKALQSYTTIGGLKVTVTQMSSDERNGQATFSLETVPTITDQYTLLEGESRTYTINGKDREVTLVFVSDPNSNAKITAKFSVDNELSEQIVVGGADTLSNGVTIYVTSISASGRVGSASFKLIGTTDNEYCLHNGNRYAVGQMFKNDCNTCTCNPGGQAVCTKIACHTASCDENSDCAAGMYCNNGVCSDIGKCTADVMLCPDGGYVGRTGPNCAFVCPGTTPKDGTCNSGCSVDNRCLPYGTRIANGEAKFCDISGIMSTQKIDGSDCQNSYECASNQCLNAKCQSLDKQLKETQGTLDRVVAWLRSIFGFGK